MEGNKKTPLAIDEKFLMEMMAGGDKMKSQELPDGEKPPVQVEVTKTTSKEKGRLRKQPEADYLEVFFKNSETAARLGKSVYIRPEFHDRLNRIVQVVGEGKITIYEYLDNILAYHFQEFGDVIVQTYNDKYKPIL